MKINYLIIGIVGMFFMMNSYANEAPTNLQQVREYVTKRYIQDLQKADYKDISELFEKGGFVVSTSRGKVDAKTFFYAFLPNIVWAKTEVHQDYRNVKDANRFSTRFNFSFKLKDGETGEGEYVDEFVFAPKSDKLTAVYMFENLKFEN